jgi:hypothetical protein
MAGWSLFYSLLCLLGAPIAVIVLMVMAGTVGGSGAFELGLADWLAGVLSEKMVDPAISETEWDY